MPAEDKDEAIELHREALHRIVTDMMRWMTRERNAARIAYGRLTLVKDKAKQQERAIAAMRADVLGECCEQLKSLRKLHKENSARASIIGHEVVDGSVVSDPSEQQIAEMRLEIQRGWTEAEREKRATSKTRDVELRSIRFDSRNRQIDFFQEGID